MSYLLRQITGNRWLGLKAPKTSKDFPADPITDLKTDSNNLSVFAIEDPDKDVDVVMTGLATNKNEIQKLAYALIKQSDLEKAGFKVKANLGKTPSDEANNLHREIEGLTVNGLVKLATIIINKSKQDTKARPAIKSLVQEAVTNNRLDVKKIKQHGMHKELKITCECKL